MLRKKVYVTAAKMRILKCLGLPEEDMQWFTLNEWESHIHVLPLWTLASFKRLKHVSNQYVVSVYPPSPNYELHKPQSKLSLNQVTCLVLSFLFLFAALWLTSKQFPLL